METSVSDPPALVAIGGSFSVTDTVINQGPVSAKASTTRYYLSTDTTKSSGDKLLTKTRSVPALEPGAVSTGTVTVTVPTTTAFGTYYLLACADGPALVAESNEANNCLASAAQVQVTAPDLMETSVSDPPALVAIGGSFSVTDTVINQGPVSAKASTTRYYLSTDTTKNSGDKVLTKTRSVPVLEPGAVSTGTVTVTVPTNTAFGTYYLLACADDTGLVVESNEANNCIASAAQVEVTAPDLMETSVSDPPALVAIGGSFSVTDTVINQGPVSAKASTTRYYLSTDTTKNSGDKVLTKTRSVPVLEPGAVSTGTVTVTIPTTTAAGTYYLLACADDTALVAESNEANNCIASGSVVEITP
jgi:subtilase family serine protease